MPCLEPSLGGLREHNATVACVRRSFPFGCAFVHQDYMASGGTSYHSSLRFLVFRLQFCALGCLHACGHMCLYKWLPACPPCTHSHPFLFVHMAYMWWPSLYNSHGNCLHGTMLHVLNSHLLSLFSLYLH